MPQTRGCQFPLLTKQQQPPPPAVHTRRRRCLASRPTLAYYSWEASVRKGVVTALYNSVSDALCGATARAAPKYRTQHNIAKDLAHSGALLIAPKLIKLTSSPPPAEHSQISHKTARDRAWRIFSTILDSAVNCSRHIQPALQGGSGRCEVS